MNSSVSSKLMRLRAVCLGCVNATCLYLHKTTSLQNVKVHEKSTTRNLLYSPFSVTLMCENINGSDEVLSQIILLCTFIRWTLFMSEVTKMQTVESVMSVVLERRPCYGRPLSIAWPKSMLCFANFILLFFYGRLMLRPRLTEVCETFTRGGPWVWIEKLLLGFFPGPP